MDDEVWAVVKLLLPSCLERSPGPRPVPDHLCLRGVLFVLHTGIPWLRRF
ncbi:transposase [Streptomyces lushanensis]